MEPLAICILSSILVALGFYIRSLRRSLEQKTHEFEELNIRNEQTGEALEFCSTYPWVYYPEDHLIAYLNKGRSKLYPPKLTLDYFIENYVHSDHRKYTVDMLEDTVNGKNDCFNLRIKMTPVDRNSVEWAHVVGLPESWNANHTHATRIIGTIQYITPEVEQENMLRENKDFLELALRTANIIPWEYILDTDTLISRTPSRLELAKPILMSEYNKYMVHPEWQESYAQEVAAVKENRRGNYIDFKVKVLNSSNEYEWVRIVGVVTERDKNGKPLRMIGATYQIEREMEREEQLDKLRMAEEANRLKTAFLANISHEIRTPLNAIVGFSQLIMESPEEAKDFIPIIKLNNKLLLKLIEDILDIAKIESGNINISASKINLNEIFNELSFSNVYQLHEGLKLIKTCPEKPFILYSDQHRILQVLNNFLNNAIKFTPEGSIEMGYTLIKEGSQVHFFVRDTGIGIDNKDKEHIFERFFKVNTFIQGTGLGLSVSELIVQKMGGSIGFDSELDKGSEFWFTLPAAPVTA